MSGPEQYPGAHHSHGIRTHASARVTQATCKRLQCRIGLVDAPPGAASSAAWERGSPGLNPGITTLGVSVGIAVEPSPSMTDALGTLYLYAKLL
jgi:hypothetical protein